MNQPEQLLNELKINRSGKTPKKKRRWPWVVGIGLALLVVLAVLRGGKPIEVETANPRI